MELRYQGKVLGGGCSNPSPSYSNANVYSFEEIRIGTWTDGRPLYKKTYAIENFATTAKTPHFITLEADPQKQLINGYGYLETNWGTTEVSRYTLPYVEKVSSGDNSVLISIGGVEDVSFWVSLWALYSVSFSGSVTVEYIKTTDAPDYGDGNQGGNITGTQIAGVPVGTICAWAKPDIPEGWALCDGQNGTPDLRGRFVLGASEDHAIGEVGGSEEVTLTIDQMPKHHHDERVRGAGGTGTQNLLYTSTPSDADVSGRLIKQDALESGTARQQYTKDTGSDQPHDNMPPYYALVYIMKVRDVPVNSPSTGVTGGANDFCSIFEIYSTEETVVGVWTNGKLVYQKTMFTKTPKVSNTWTAALSLSDLGIDEIVDIRGSVIYSNGSTMNIPYASTPTFLAAIAADPNVVSLWVTDSDLHDLDARVTLRYTKTADSEGPIPNNASGSHIYSDAEVIDGVYYDEIRYAKCFKAKAPSTAGNITVGEIGDLNIDKVISISGVCGTIPCNFYFGSDYYVSTWINGERNLLTMHVPTALVNADIFVRIVYTKKPKGGG